MHSLLITVGEGPLSPTSPSLLGDIIKPVTHLHVNRLYGTQLLVLWVCFTDWCCRALTTRCLLSWDRIHSPFFLPLAGNMILLDGFQHFSKDSIFLNRCLLHEIYNMVFHNTILLGFRVHAS